MNAVILDNSGCPLYAEPHAVDYNGHQFLTLLQFRNNDVLTIVDARTNTELRCYVLDLCAPTETDMMALLQHAIEWHNTSPNLPFSVYLTNINRQDQFVKVLRTFNVEYVTRVVGQVPTLIPEVAELKKRRRRLRTSKTRKTQS